MTGQVELGRVIGAFGIKGWIRLNSRAEPPEKILRYRKWFIAGREWKVTGGHEHSGAVVASLEGLEDRDAALALSGAAIEVSRSALPKAKKGEFYWMDVLGAQVTNTAGVELGRLESLTDNGAQDVMVVRQGDIERLIPFVVGPIVIGVDTDSKRILVEWDPQW